MNPLNKIFTWGMVVIDPKMNIEVLLNTFSLYLLAFGVIALTILAVIALKIKNLSEDNKKLVFLAIVLVTLIPTIAMSASTVYINTISSSGGPVHWHADIEIWKCGEKMNLKDPVGRFSNKIGNPTLHEHNDERIHLEGVVLTPLDASLGRFFEVIDGRITSTTLEVPTNEGQMIFNNGDFCPGDISSAVQVFVYTTDENDTYTQRKLEEPENYIISPESIVPAGDCIIVEFDAPKEQTDKLCRSYKVAEEIDKVRGGRN